MSSRSAFQRHLPLTRWIPLGRPFPTSWPWISSSVLRSLDTVISKPQACFPPTACRDFTDSSLLDLSLPPLFPLPLPHPDKSCFNCYHSFLSLYSFILFKIIYIFLHKYNFVGSWHFIILGVVSRQLARVTATLSRVQVTESLQQTICMLLWPGYLTTLVKFSLGMSTSPPLPYSTYLIHTH